MDEAILYDLICDKTIDKWRDEFEKEDCPIKQNMFKQRDLLYAAVDEENRKLVDRYKLAIENYFDYLYLCVDIKLINTCIKIGMEMQKFYDENNG
ncbi:MAG: hypothetical protein K2K04_02630 [Clostridia bacterium]|nr:hypothetical protein [Clostridia bacterium]